MAAPVVNVGNRGELFPRLISDGLELESVETFLSLSPTSDWFDLHLIGSCLGGLRRYVGVADSEEAYEVLKNIKRQIKSTFDPVVVQTHRRVTASWFSFISKLRIADNEPKVPKGAKRPIGPEAPVTGPPLQFDLIVVYDLATVDASMQEQIVRQCVEHWLKPDGVGIVIVGAQCPVTGRFVFDVRSTVWPPQVRHLMTRPLDSTSLDRLIEQNVGCCGVDRRYEFDCSIDVRAELSDKDVETFAYAGQLDSRLTDVERATAGWQKALTDSKDGARIRQIYAWVAGGRTHIDGKYRLNVIRAQQQQQQQPDRAVPVAAVGSAVPPTGPTGTGNDALMSWLVEAHPSVARVFDF